jgi:hypothetical protein
VAPAGRSGKGNRFTLIGTVSQFHRFANVTSQLKKIRLSFGLEAKKSLIGFYQMRQF